MQLSTKYIVGAGMAVTLFAFAASRGTSETVDVKYRGPVDLKYFSCSEIDRSSFIRRVCYDRANTYMVINLNGTYYHYCEIDGGTVDSLMAAESMGRFFNASIKGHFDCRINRIPAY